MLHNCVGIALPELAGKRPPFLASKVKSEFLDALASLVSNAVDRAGLERTQVGESAPSRLEGGSTSAGADKV